MAFVVAVLSRYQINICIDSLLQRVVERTREESCMVVAFSATVANFYGLSKFLFDFHCFCWQAMTMMMLLLCESVREVVVMVEADILLQSCPNYWQLLWLLLYLVCENKRSGVCVWVFAVHFTDLINGLPSGALLFWHTLQNNVKSYQKGGNL